MIQADSDSGDTVTFHQLIDLIIEKETVKGALNADTLARFKRRVLESHRTWQAIDLRHNWANLRDKPLTLPKRNRRCWSAMLFILPKSHEPFNEAEARRYLPDFASRFPLRWFAVERELIRRQPECLPAGTSAALCSAERAGSLRSLHRHLLATADAPVAGRLSAEAAGASVW
ncbi:IucA/IucC family protein [Enterobacter hormaechei]